MWYTIYVLKEEDRKRECVMNTNPIKRYVKENYTKLLRFIGDVTEECLYDEDKLNTTIFDHFGEVLYDLDEGASKKVIIFKELGFVIKWDDSGDSWREANLYTEAVYEGLEDFFPFTSHICEHLNCDWVVQEIAKPYYSYKKTEMVKRATKAHIRDEAVEILFNIFSDIPNCSRLGYPNHLWIAISARFFGLTLMGKLARFVQKNRINDLHNGNIGFIGDRPVLIDFCGYHWEDDYYYDSDD